MFSGRRRVGQRRRPTQSRPIQKELVRQVGEIAASEDLRLPQQDHAHVRRTVSSAPRYRVVFPFSLRFPGHRVRLLFHPLFMAPSTQAVPPSALLLGNTAISQSNTGAQCFGARPCSKSPLKKLPRVPPHFAVPTEIRPSCGNKPLLRKQLNGHRRRATTSRPYASRRRASLRTQNASPSPKRMINRCSDFIYRAPVSLIKKPCYDRIYGLSRTMRCL